MRPLPLGAPVLSRLNLFIQNRAFNTTRPEFLSEHLSPPAQKDLSGKSALITGASRGIGLAIAKRFAAEGVKCTLMGRKEAALQRVAADLPGGHEIISGDVGDIETWTRIGAQNVGYLHVLICLLQMSSAVSTAEREESS